MTIQNQILTLIILLCLSAFFSASETALVSLSRLRVRYLVDKKKRGALTLKKLKDDPHKMLSTLLVGNNLVNVAASALATSIAITLLKSNAVGIAVGVMTFLILVFGEIIPKTFATQNNRVIALLVAEPIWILSIIFYPIMKFLDLFVIPLNKLLKVSQKKKPVVTEEELRSMVKLGREVGSIKEIEMDMIENIFKFDNVNVDEIMTPRTDMKRIDVKSKVKDVLNLVTKVPYSRFPVYEKHRDNIVGIVYVKDVLRYLKGNKTNISVRKVMRKPYFVPETKKLDSMLKQFQQRKEQMAIVVDEHGGISGLVTLEDVLEEIVGEIVDETEKIKPNINKIGLRKWRVQAKTEVDDVNKKLKTNFKREDVDTFGGFLIKKLGRIPKEGEEIEIDNFVVKISDMDKNRIKEVELKKK